MVTEAANLLSINARRVKQREVTVVAVVPERISEATDFDALLTAIRAEFELNAPKKVALDLTKVTRLPDMGSDYARIVFECVKYLRAHKHTVHFAVAIPDERRDSFRVQRLDRFVLVTSSLDDLLAHPESWTALTPPKPRVSEPFHRRAHRCTTCDAELVCPNGHAQ